MRIKSAVSLQKLYENMQMNQCHSRLVKSYRLLKADAGRPIFHGGDTSSKQG